MNKLKERFLINNKGIVTNLEGIALTIAPSGQKAQELINDQFAILLYIGDECWNRQIRHRYYNLVHTLICLKCIYF